MTGLVTGATGYLGRKLVRRLVEDHWRVHALTRPGSATSDLEGVTLHPVGSDARAMQAALDAVQPDVVFHLASSSALGDGPDEAADLVQANIAYPTTLLATLRRGRCRRIVVAGSYWQHADASDDYSPSSLYAATKQAFEDVCAYYARTQGFAFQILKLFDVYGPGDSRPKLIPSLLKASAIGQPLKMSPGEQEIDLVHVDDVISAFLSAAGRLTDLRPSLMEQWAVRSGEVNTLRTLVGKLEAATGKPLTIDWGGLPYRENQIMKLWRGGRPPPGWTPKVSLEEGLKGITQGEYCR